MEISKDVVTEHSKPTRSDLTFLALNRVEENTKKALSIFMDPALRDLIDTRRRCSRLWMDIYGMVGRVTRQCYPGVNPNPKIVFDEAFYNYQLYYDDEAVKRMHERAQEINPQPLPLHNPHYPLEIDLEKLEKPDLSKYLEGLPERLRTTLPLYIATYFVPRPHLPFPQELKRITK